jgi:EAL domain-containing protein (putative c-di-GMP-specific phosphodiesterase class I)
VESAYLAETGSELCRRMQREFDDDAFVGLSPKLEFRVGHAMLSQSPFYRFERRVYAALEEARAYNEQRERRRESSWSGELQRIIQTSAVDTVFQPVVDLRTRAVLGYEAFARGPKDSLFEHPRTLFSMSSRFGVAADLDRICREAALRALAMTGGKGKVFLNALPISLGEEQWRQDSLLQLLADVPLEPGDLVLEFSERCADADPDRFVAALEQLKEAGFAVALDDVGTGYASQTILERLRPDYLKLDVSLVRNIHENLIKQELLASLIRIAGRMGATVVAEGVESHEEVEALLEAGARYGQGYLFAVPAPAASAMLPGEPKQKEH